MKSYCENCTLSQPSSFVLCKDAVTGEAYEDLLCNACGFIVATVQERESLAQPEQKPVAWRSLGKMKNGLLGFRFATDRSTFHDDPDQQALCLCQSPQRPRVLFPTMLRKMWSGGEVQAWLDENVNKENT